MCQILFAIDAYRIRKAEAVGGLDAEKQILILLWDVYSVHIERYLLDEWMKENVPCILILFVPANMTELCQPLDVGFNFEFKRAVANARKEWIAKLVIDLVAEEGAEAAASSILKNTNV